MTHGSQFGAFTFLAPCLAIKSCTYRAFTWNSTFWLATRRACLCCQTYIEIHMKVRAYTNDNVCECTSNKLTSFTMEVLYATAKRRQPTLYTEQAGTTITYSEECHNRHNTSSNYSRGEFEAAIQDAFSEALRRKVCTTFHYA